MMEKMNKISSGQIIFLVYSIIMGTGLNTLPGPSVMHAKQDAWLCAVVAALGGAGLGLLVTKLCKLFPGKTIFEFSEMILGQFLGKLVGLVYIWLGVHVCAQVVREMSSLIVISIMPETPLIVLIIFLLSLSAYSVYGGIEVLVRVNQILMCLYILGYFILYSMALSRMNVMNLLPIFDVPFVSVVKGAILIDSWVGEIIILAAIIPFLNKPEKSTKAVLSGVFLGIFFVGISNAGLVAMLGPNIPKGYIIPILNAVRDIQLLDVIERLDPIFAAMLVSGGFVKIGLFHWLAAKGSAQVAGLQDYRPVIIPIAFVVAPLSILIYPSTLDIQYFSNNVWPVYSLIIFEAGIPLLLLIIALLKNRGQTVCRR